MTRQQAIIGIIVLISLAFSSGCRDYPDDGMFAVELYWEIPPSDDAGVSDADAPEPGGYGECEQAGVVRFDYQLEDLSDCIRYSNDWECRVVEYDRRITCDNIPVLDYDWIGGGDYRIKIWGVDKDGFDSWYATCPDLDKEGSFFIDGAFYVDDALYMDGSDTDKAYPCDVSFYPKSEDK